MNNYNKIHEILSRAEAEIKEVLGYAVRLQMGEKLVEKNISVDRIIEIISEVWGYKAETIKSKHKPGDIPDCRHMCVFCIRERYPKLTWSVIGNAMGGRDHSTAMASYDKHKEIYETDENYRIKYSTTNKMIDEEIIQIMSNANKL